PLHEHLKERGAVFGEVAGWERANWFARPGQEREYRYSWKRQNWFDNQREEHLAIRNKVGLFDMTSFGKIRVEGRDACVFLQKLIQKVSPNDFSNENNPFGTFQEIEIGMGLARAHRVTYVGELGWELYVSTDQAAHVFEAIDEAGADAGLKLCGLHTLDSCRIEKAFRHFGHDITDEDNVLEAGLGFAVKTAKGDFIGRDAVLKKKEAG